MGLICYLHPGWRPLVRPAGPQHDWMDDTPESFAYRCLPLSIANAHGWEVATPCAVEAWWDGGDSVDAVKIAVEGQVNPASAPSSMFGQGVLTFHVAGVFRTPAGWNLWMGGPPNQAKDGIRRRERAMMRFRRMKTLQKFTSVHASVHNHFNQDRHLISREEYKADAQPRWPRGGPSQPNPLAAWRQPRAVETSCRWTAPTPPTPWNSVSMDVGRPKPTYYSGKYSGGCSRPSSRSESRRASRT